MTKVGDSSAITDLYVRPQGAAYIDVLEVIYTIYGDWEQSRNRVVVSALESILGLLKSLKIWKVEKRDSCQGQRTEAETGYQKRCPSIIIWLCVCVSQLMKLKWAGGC